MNSVTRKGTITQGMKFCFLMNSITRTWNSVLPPHSEERDGSSVLSPHSEGRDGNSILPPHLLGRDDSSVLPPHSEERMGTKSCLLSQKEGVRAQVAKHSFV